MKYLKRAMPLLISACMMAAVLSGCGAAPSSSGTGDQGGVYPSRDIQGSIMWSAGGVCDVTARGIGAIAQEILGTDIIFTNRAGAGGAVSTAYVDAQRADGYELLFGAENPQIAKVMGTSEIDYDDFTPVALHCTTYAVVSVGKDSPYNTVEELVDAVLAEGSGMIMATTGAGGLPEVVAAMWADVLGTAPTMVPFDGENECMTAIMGGNADYTITTLGSAAGFYRSGDIKILAVMAEETVPGYEEVPVITDSYNGFGKYLPWGPFYGVFVKNGTDASVVETLAAAFTQAADDQAYLDLIAANGCFPMNLSGDEAVEYIRNYRSVTSWLLYDSGTAVNSPEDYGIAKP